MKPVNDYRSCCRLGILVSVYLLPFCATVVLLTASTADVGHFLVAFKMVQYTVESLFSLIILNILINYVWYFTVYSKKHICTIQKFCSSSTFIAAQPNFSLSSRLPIRENRGWRCVPLRTPIMIVDSCSCCRNLRMLAMFHALSSSVCFI